MAITHVNGPLPGPRGRELLETWHQYEADVTGFQAPVVWEKARGCQVTDVDGNVYLDWTSGVLVTNVGHCHPHLVRAAQEASAQLLNNYECPNVQRIQAAKRLVEALPKHLDTCFFLSTGSEATEAAARLMRRATGRFELLSFVGAFHGRTYGAAGMGGLPGPKRLYGPSLPGIVRAPFPNPYRDAEGWCEGGPTFQRFFDHLDLVVDANASGPLAGLIVEPYQGAAGFIFPPPGWLKRLEAWARARDMLFTLDEVQASYGRTGRMWAMEHEELTPDIVTIGKAIGSGVPVSAVAASRRVFGCLQKGEMSSTLGGNPVASAAVCAVLDIFEREGLVANAQRMGARMKTRLEALSRRSPYLGDVRGMGLVMGLEFVKDKATREPAKDLTRRVIVDSANRGLLVGSVGMYGNVIRVAPPLVITPEEVDESLAIMERVVLGLEA